MSSIQPAPRPELTRALQLLATIELATRSGDWIVDGACDPDHLIQLVSSAVDQQDAAKAAHFSGILARECLNAIAGGYWRPQEGNIAFLESIAIPPQVIDPSSLAC